MRRAVLLLTLVGAATGCTFDSAGGAPPAGTGSGGIGGTGGVGGSGATGGTGGIGTGGDGGTGGIGGSGGIGGTGGTGGTGATGGSGGDMIDAGVPDAPMNQGGCTVLGQRVCIDSMTAAHCDAIVGGVFGPTADRTCPPGSMCMSGHCRSPTGAMGCNGSRTCMNNQVCDAYVNSNNALVGFCTDPFAGATGDVTASCTDNSTCKTGLCATDNMGNHECYFVCQNNGDCPSGTCRPITQPTTLEGTSTTGLKGCF